MSARPYVASPFAPQRRRTRVVRVGDVAIGGANPIRVQSMTTTDTLDTRATADQAERLAAAGCEIVRITAPSIREAENLREIKAELLRRGVRVPLVADIHFTPNAALEAALHVEKVRVNPGNYADKKRFEARDYSDAEYAEEVARVHERFAPLVRRLKQEGRALRIGTNHGSLSDRIMNRFGDTPAGMVESALEFLAVCEAEAHYDVVFSMKASNPQVAIHAYRLLAARLAERAAANGDDASYPFHVGVTEAGDGEDGRVKSAIGIGALLEDGLGDTIRVSLTEHPVAEVPVAAALARRAEALWAAAATPPADPGADFCDDPYAHRRRTTRPVAEIGGANPVRVELGLGAVPAEPEAAATELGAALDRAPDLACEGLLVDVHDLPDPARLDAWVATLRAGGRTMPISVRAESRIAL
ncbi:MAG TPA: (E)-4-hydroxy-3-methylbut-2-enyl-diphosphate synthase, partial [Myxococcota bacterium]|nr:(E)-4-hydroxy-3-methylbut-2-enyl-diphosphate synthase [Myxococcota bacterium]